MRKKAFCICLLISISYLLSCTNCTDMRIIYYGKSEIQDYKKFPNRPLEASPKAFCFKEEVPSAYVLKKIVTSNGAEVSLDEFLKSTKTVAFLIIKDDRLLFEKYFDGYDKTSLILTFSMTKSFFSMLIGCAIEDGYIKSVEQPVTDFVPELSKSGFTKVTIKHLLQMTSDLNYAEETWWPFSLHNHLYYGTNIEKELFNLKLRGEPGKGFEYQSANTQLLGLILSRVLKTKTISEYMEEKIWSRIGTEYDGFWSIDHEGRTGLEKTTCCISARARDVAKLGRLYLHYGNWNGEQIVPRIWVEQSTRVDTSDGSPWYYQYQWWIASEEDGDYMASGHLGQYLYINPKKQTIIVRFGKSRGITTKEWKELFKSLANERSPGTGN